MNPHGLFNRCFEIFRGSPALFMGIAVLPYATLHAGLLSLTWAFVRSIGEKGADLAHRWQAMTATNKLEFLALFFLGITVPFAVAGRGVCRIACHRIAGRETTFQQEVYGLVRFTPSAVALAVIASIVSLLGAAFFLIPGLVVGGFFSFALPVAAVESIGPLAALRRATSAVRPVLGRVLMLFFAYSVVVFAALVLQGNLLRAVPNVMAIRAPIFLICSFIPIIPLALLFICLTLLYLEVRAPQSERIEASSR
jgi:hypothetical protein